MGPGEVTAMPAIAPDMTLASLLAGLASVSRAHDRFVTGLCLDSRRVVPGDLFLAVQGSRDHGADHVAEALGRGAVAVVQGAVRAESMLDGDVPVIYLPGLEHRLGELADRFHGRPSRHLHLTGVTGTNGKTSVCHFVAEALSAGGTPCGTMGTLGRGVHGRLEPTANTTPDVLTVHRTFAEWRNQGLTAGIMEVSSHGLVQGRVDAVAFDVAVFTNLGRDHLDYHGDLGAYAAAKRRLFQMPGLGTAVINVDDAEGRRLAALLAPRLDILTYSLEGRPDAGLRVTRGDFDAAGMTLHIETPAGAATLSSGLAGRFQGANLLAAMGVLLATGLTAEDAARRLAGVHALPGRFERFGDPSGPVVIVDYAHTPDALEQVLGAARALGRGRLTCVFGCGGERDPGKRPAMGAIAARLADHVVVSDDNPRHEDPDDIVADILAGMLAGRLVTVERDRERAIAAAVAAAAPGDLVVVAGKGHEDYQEVAGVRHPFSDREVARRLVGGTAP